MNCVHEVVINGSFTTNQTSNAVYIDYMFGFSVHLEYGGTAPVGTVTVQGTNDDPRSTTATPVWSDEPTSVAISAAGDTLLNFSNRFYRFVRVKLVRTSGTIALKATVMAKGN